MVVENILIKFFVILTVLFFIPKLITKYTKISPILIEVILGILLGIALPSIFFLDDMLQILGTLGIITLFVFAGMEVNPSFIFSRKRVFIENIFIFIVLLAIVGVSATLVFRIPVQVGLLTGLALITPSASFIIASSKGFGEQEKKWIESKAITGEVAALFIMIILLKWGEWIELLTTFAAIMVLVVLMPLLLKLLYRKIFSKLIETEFSFIFVIAIISAFITEFFGVHFLIGAFIAGIVAKRFISEVVASPEYAKIRKTHGKQIITGFNFFAIVFTPFYFFTIGLKLTPDIFTVTNVLIALALVVVITLIRTAFMTAHRMTRVKESFLKATKVSISLVPTLVITFVLAEILRKEFSISLQIFGILLLYGVFTAIVNTILLNVHLRKEHKKT
ncbi:hypothetical protein C4573_04520 [Candidatus Woesearchaeota archaeon]|nr:MAG: hypothetical protein C4573_04520 [Candidatus Woesearchaeota archaeon]